jgi:hypothetical protein
MPADDHISSLVLHAIIVKRIPAGRKKRSLRDKEAYAGKWSTTLKRISQSRSFFLPLSLFLIAVITRIPFTSKLLYHMDSVNFALALKKYDITVHQPHPPGYFLYVMLGRFLNLFIENANTVFVSISIIFTGLTVIAVYFLGRELYDRKIGLIASLLALTSPNLWFHGEVALSYAVEAFFSTAIAFLCWKIYTGKYKYIYLSVAVLGIAGGIRQNTVVMLLPLWLYSARGIPARRVFAALGLLSLICVSWFVPMVLMTGGWHAYQNAFKELWLFNTGQYSVFQKGWSSFRMFSRALFEFTVYGLGAGIFILGIALYSLIRDRKMRFLITGKTFFFALWTLPSILFYLLIFIDPINPGYALIFLPAFFILVALSVANLSEKFARVFKINLTVPAVLVLLFINTGIFLFTGYPVTYRDIRNHDAALKVMLENIRNFSPSETAVFVKPQAFFGYGQIMYYLPHYRVYEIVEKVSPAGQVRKTFGGFGGETFVTDEIVLPEGINRFVIPFIGDDAEQVSGVRGLNETSPLPGMLVASGPITLIPEIYADVGSPFTNIRIEGNRKSLKTTAVQ